MYLWKCCECLRDNHSDRYHCIACSHGECEFCLPFAGPASILPNVNKIASKASVLQPFVSILKRPQPDDPSFTVPSTVLQKTRTPQQTQISADQPADQPAEKLDDKRTDPPASLRMAEQVQHLAKELAEEKPLDQHAKQTPGGPLTGRASDPSCRTPVVRSPFTQMADVITNRDYGLFKSFH
ncbi:hypothetical protein MMC07_003936 [Pseudocyphellaria aurata]|nr:hypothetical protein [Pseudocyphellaria aurata]